MSTATESGSKREEFLEIMDEIIIWDDWVDVVMPYYLGDKRDRPPKGIEKMLHIYLLQVWFNLSDEGTEDAIYASYAMRKLVGINFMEEDASDATTLLKFRRLLETYGLNKLFFDAFNRVLGETGHMLKRGTVVDAMIINTSPSTKNMEKERDPEMRQTKKSNEWRFGMKCHIGEDTFSGLVYTIEVTPANVHDVNVSANLIREDDEVMCDDSGSVGTENRVEVMSDEHLSSIAYHINRRPRSLQKVSDYSFDWDRIIERAKSSVRYKVEHPFRIVKCLFAFKKVAYRGLVKNENRLYTLFASANPYVGEA